MPPPSRILFQEYGIQLRAESNDSLVLCVLCGRIGEFEVEFTLNEEERLAFQAGGEEYLRQLSRDVQNNWRRFRDRVT